MGAPHHKRAEVIHWDVETVMTTVTQWLPAGDSRLGTQYTQGSGGDQSSYHPYGNTAESSAASSTTLATSTTSSSSSVAGAATSVSAAYIPVSSALSSSATVSPISNQQAAVVPVASTTSSTTVSSTSSVIPTSDTPTQTATTQAAYSTPAPASSTPLSSSAPPASSSAASSSGSSGSGTASYLNGHCSGPDNTCSGDLTTYTAGTGTCGFTDSDSDMIVALSRRSWEAVSAKTDYMTGNMLCSFCSKKISITLNGNTQIGTIRDKCDGNQCANVTVSVPTARLEISLIVANVVKANHEYDIDLSTALFTAIGGTAARGRYSPAVNGGNDIVTWYFL